MADVLAVANVRELSEALALREAVLAGANAGAPWSTRDAYDRDPTTLHCIVRGPDGVCVGAGRLTAPEDRFSDGEMIEGYPVIGPIVVAPSARGRGVARAILAFLEAEAVALYGRNGAVRVETWVPADAGGRVSRLGYRVVDGAAERLERPALRAAKDLAAS
jgi:GNAT superfamily N-acetyltransferase